MCRLAKAFLSLTVVFVLTGTNSFAAPDLAISTEYKIKAAFLYKFINFIEWQSGSSGTKSICIFGDNPFGDTLEQIVAVHDPRFESTRVIKSSDPAQIQNCNILFISRSEEGNLFEILDGLRTRPTLTVSDIRNFARAGGMIEFVLEGDHIRFIINQPQARDDGLKISSQLLSLSKNISLGQ